MKKKLSILLALSALALTIPLCSAGLTRTTEFVPSISFSGNQATCTVNIIANRMTDKISASMELYQGNTLVNSWKGSGTGILKMEKTASVTKGKTYTLTVSSTTNGTSQPPVSVTKTYK